MRINKFLALAGVASRRQCDQLILQGVVIVNGNVAHYGLEVSQKDDIKVNGKSIFLHKKEYYLFHKPVNVLTTLADPFQRKTVKDFIVHIKTRVFPVGRLDYDSYGLILLTNDGDLAHRLQHPKYGVAKVYRVKVDQELSGQEEKQFQEGLMLEEGKTSPCKIEKIGAFSYEVTLHQGWKRQIRRMFQVFDKHVLDLKRVQIGPLKIGDLKEGDIRLLEEQEILVLKKK